MIGRRRTVERRASPPGRHCRGRARRPSLHLLLLGGRFCPLRQRAQEWVCSLWRLDGFLQRCAEWDHTSVKLPRAVLILFDDRAIQFEPSEEPASTRIAKDLSPPLPIGIGSRVTAHGPSGCAGIGANLELARQQV